MKHKFRDLKKLSCRLLFIASPVFAATQINGAHVGQIATTQLYVQNSVIFSLDKGTTECAAGSWVYYNSTNPNELKAIYATILAARLANTPLWVAFEGSCAAVGISVQAQQ